MAILEKISNKGFRVRLKETRIWTDLMVQHLKDIGHIKNFVNSTPEEDENDLIDYWFEYKGGIEPVSFKLRVEPRYRDIPVLLRQPFYGTNNEKTVIGRDYRCLKSSVKQYYVAVKNADGEFCEIYRISKGKLLPIVEDVMTSWQSESTDYGTFIPYSKLTEQKNKQLLKEANGNKKFQTVWRHLETEIWWQKNPDWVEKSPKINAYVPEHLKEESFAITSKAHSKMLKTCQEMKGN